VHRSRQLPATAGNCSITAMDTTKAKVRMGQRLLQQPSAYLPFNNPPLLLLLVLLWLLASTLPRLTVTQCSLPSHLDNVPALEGVFAESHVMNHQ
jgi:hypothetical protein